MLKSKLIGSCVQSDIKSNPKWSSSPWLKLSLSKESMVFLPTRLLSAASGPSDPWPGRTRNRQSGSDKSRGGDPRDLNTCSLALQRRVALTMAKTSGWQWQRSRQDTRPSVGYLTYPASWIFNNWTIWNTIRLSVLVNLHFCNVWLFCIND